MEFYQFTVNDTKEIDFARIFKEQKEEGNLISLVTFEGPQRQSEFMVLLVHNDFLQEFQPGDGVKVGGEPLNPRWGNRYVKAELYAGRVYVCADNHPGCGVHLEDGRAIVVHPDQLPEIRQQIETARNYVRRVRVKVHTL